MANFILLLFILALTIFFICGVHRSWQRSAHLTKLIAEYAEKPHDPAILDIIYEDLQRDSRLNRLLKKHNATKEDISVIYHKLLQWGNFKKRRHFIPISSFYFKGSLSYLLKHKDADAKTITMKMFNYFHI
ncbi:hypothetical protein TAMA11512_10940 [Selenomonas sp. TAMA-11512]|uniref:hypothetical protein n=1 Tax=Selenomonas sp. TAMA-11512 TaxID=3095337 RepID=UPI00309266B9|nr:hypothetical protein TAMA11512_10940 [Selenomonas sp. TAMA-11512]